MPRCAGNLEWQVCAAKGKLPYQGSKKMIFAVAPSELDPSGATGKPLGQCKGWVPGRRPQGGIYGYATDDVRLEAGSNSRSTQATRFPRMLPCRGLASRRVCPCAAVLAQIFYLELCLLNQICTNGERIFSLRAGEEFECDYSTQRFRQLQELLLSPPAPPPPQAMRCTGSSMAQLKKADKIAGDGLPTCATCWRVNGGGGDCSIVRGCNHERCDFCTNHAA